MRCGRRASYTAALAILARLGGRLWAPFIERHLAALDAPDMPGAPAD